MSVRGYFSRSPGPVRRGWDVPVRFSGDVSNGHIELDAALRLDGLAACGPLRDPVSGRYCSVAQYDRVLVSHCRIPPGDGTT